MKTTTKKFLALLMAALMTCALFNACAKAKADDPVVDVPDETQTDVKESEDTPEAEKRTDLVIAMESEPPTLHPFDHTAVTAGYMNTLTYNSLFKTDPVTLEPVPDLCESWQQVDDVTWQFKIYENILFHDGTHMTAEDVVASMEYARE